MMKGIGGVILIIGSLFYTFKGLYELLRMKKISIVIMYLSFIVGYPFVFLYTKDWLKANIENDMLSISLFTLLLLPGFFWLLIGYIINKTVEKYRDQNKKHKKLQG